MSAGLLVVLAAGAMEPLAALSHRTVMHGRGRRWHASHHASSRGSGLGRPDGFEANDLFPLWFALATVAIMALGAFVGPLAPLLWIGTGVTLYGAAYLLVHDVCIHGRLGRPFGRGRYLSWVREAHRAHHRTGGAPYGFLVPVVPRERRRVPIEVTCAAPTVASLRPVESRSRPEKTS
jgi:beta-carotene 3-hydroxylase